MHVVVGKFVYRASLVDQEVLDMTGAPILVRHNGPMERVDVGTVLTDVTEDELRAFPDRFAIVEDVVPEEPKPPEEPVHGTRHRRRS